MVDRLDVRGATRRAHACLEPRAYRLVERPRLGQVIGLNLRYGRAAAFEFAQDLDDPAVHDAPLRLHHGLVRHSLQQRVAELVADFGAVAPRQQDFGVDQRLQAFLNLRGIVL